MSRFQTVFFAALFGFGGCAPAALPEAAAPHRRLQETGKSNAPAAVETARRRAAEIVQEADRAAEAGDREAAAALYAVAETHLDIADATLQEASLDEKIQAEEAEIRDIERSVEQLRDAIVQEEQARERIALRLRLESVVSETERAAAAEEEYRARFKGEKTTRARRAVGGHWIERAALLVETVEAYAALGLVESVDAQAVQTLLAHAETALGEGDLLAVESRCAAAAAQARERLYGAWTGGMEGATGAAAALEAALDKRGIPFEKDDLGLWIDLGDTSKRTTPAAKATLEKLTAALQAAPAAVVALSASPTEIFSDRAAEKSRENAVKIAELLTSSGTDARAVRARGCGEFSPIPSLASGKSPAALLLFPIPVIQTK